MMPGTVLEMLIAEYNQVFGTEPLPLEEYLSDVPRPTVLTVGSHFLGFRAPHKHHYTELIPEILHHNNPSLSKEVVALLYKLEKRIGTPITVLNTISSLELFEYAFENLGPGNTGLSNKEIEEKIVRAYLAINQRTRALENAVFPTTDHLSGLVRIYAMYFTKAYHSSDLENFRQDELFTGQLIKAIFFFEYLETHEKLKPLLDEFLAFFACDDWKQYLHRLLPIINNYLKGEKDGLLDIIVPKNEKFEESIEFLDKLIAVDAETLHDFDYKKIRARPLYRVEEGKYRVIFGMFMIEKIYKGLFFKLSELNGLRPKKEQIKSLHSIIADEFSEQVMVYNLLGRIYGKRSYTQFSGQQMKESGMIAEPDYYIRNGKRIFLFESKDFMIRAREKTSYDYRVLEPELIKKFVEDGGPKAIPQLINNIQRILTSTFPVDSDYSVSTVIIYPILILHDHQYNTIGLNSIINIWFKEEIKKLALTGVPTTHVRGLTIINMDTLIFHQELLQDKSLILEDLIEGYHKKATFDEKKKYPQGEKKTAAIRDSMIPFSNYINSIVADKGIARVPKMIREKGFSLFDKK